MQISSTTERLQAERWRLLNAYGYGPYQDGRISQRLAEIEATLNGTLAAKERKEGT